ncbi:V-set and immunoglobulin domain-containing protein 8 [Alligator mississippiensis]|uniref:V-set and immunoglobulin domain-containing protein 8 n=1 Tax=Alligator mississippiensis TaxID=8496 RepID=UPI002877C10C|nr:V-set and immunoglobulin domain-containing protein 8 [Alligator mississippiensis]
MAQQSAALLLLLCLLPALPAAVQISARGREVLYLAKGETVKLGCPYTLEPEDNGSGALGIEWIQLSPDTVHPDSVFLTYQDQQVRYPGTPGLQHRVAFVQKDPSQHDASIQLANLQVSDTATYQCRVRKHTLATHEVTITVQEKPVTPQCWTEGEQVEGSNVVLKCYCQGGSAPLSYQWSRVEEDFAAGGLPLGTGQGHIPGELYIHSLSQQHAGIYQCRVANRVGYSQCRVTISVSSGAARVWVIVGSILGSLLFLILLILLIWGLLWYHRRRCCWREVPGDSRNSASATPGRASPQHHSISYLQCQQCEQGDLGPCPVHALGH